MAAAVQSGGYLPLMSKQEDVWQRPAGRQQGGSARSLKCVWAATDSRYMQHCAVEAQHTATIPVTQPADQGPLTGTPRRECTRVSDSQASHITMEPRLPPLTMSRR